MTVTATAAPAPTAAAAAPAACSDRTGDAAGPDLVSAAVRRDGDALVVQWTTAQEPSQPGPVRYEVRTTDDDGVERALHVERADGRTTQWVEESGSVERVNLLGQATVEGPVVTARFPLELVADSFSFEAGVSADGSPADRCPDTAGAPVRFDGR